MAHPLQASELAKGYLGVGVAAILVVRHLEYYFRGPQEANRETPMFSSAECWENAIGLITHEVLTTFFFFAYEHQDNFGNFWLEGRCS